MVWWSIIDTKNGENAKDGDAKVPLWQRGSKIATDGGSCLRRAILLTHSSSSEEKTGFQRNLHLAGFVWKIWKGPIQIIFSLFKPVNRPASCYSSTFCWCSSSHTRALGVPLLKNWFLAALLHPLLPAQNISSKKYLPTHHPILSQIFKVAKKSSVWQLLARRIVWTSEPANQSELPFVKYISHTN